MQLKEYSTVPPKLQDILLHKIRSSILYTPHEDINLRIETLVRNVPETDIKKNWHYGIIYDIAINSKDECFLIDRGEYDFKTLNNPKNVLCKYNKSNHINWLAISMVNNKRKVIRNWVK